MIDGVVLDLDGTLLDTEALYRRAFTAALAAEDLTISPALYASLVGLPTEDRGTALRRHFGPVLPWQRCLGRYYEVRARLLADGVPLKPGAVELLCWVAGRGLPMAIATSASLSTAELHLARTGLRRYFTSVVTRDHVRRRKPDPESFLAAAEALGVDSCDCVAVEDSRHGVEAGLAAGMQVFAVPGEAGLVFARGATLVSDLHALRRLLEREREAEPHLSCNVQTTA